MYKLAELHRVRAFLTGKLLSTLLDLMTLCVLAPILFLLVPTPAQLLLACVRSEPDHFALPLARWRTLYSELPLLAVEIGDLSLAKPTLSG